MPLPTLHCSATNCIHNYYERCTATHIRVSGGDTVNEYKTNCETYRKGKRTNPEDTHSDTWLDPARLEPHVEMADLNTDRAAPQILCDAQNCNYNNNFICRARTVMIRLPRNKRCNCMTFMTGNDTQE
ncbi:MAG: DUF1540 domain-containing protein [Eubacteriales bacterium]